MERWSLMVVRIAIESGESCSSRVVVLELRLACFGVLEYGCLGLWYYLAGYKMKDSVFVNYSS